MRLSRGKITNFVTVSKESLVSVIGCEEIVNFVEIWAGKIENFADREEKNGEFRRSDSINSRISVVWYENITNFVDRV